jgi:hypothetical protein
MYHPAGYVTVTHTVYLVTVGTEYGKKLGMIINHYFMP